MEKKKNESKKRRVLARRGFSISEHLVRELTHKEASMEVRETEVSKESKGSKGNAPSEGGGERDEEK